jgi:REP element-mobilizing transposase RayT
LNSFIQLAAEKKDTKNGAARKFVDPSYFDPTLGQHKSNLIKSYVNENTMKMQTILTKLLWNYQA